MDNVQLQKSFISKPSSLTFKSYLKFKFKFSGITYFGFKGTKTPILLYCTIWTEHNLLKFSFYTGIVFL
jgi:hypothetical protein